MSPFVSPPCGSDDGGGSSAGYITPPEALSPPRRNSCSPNGKRHSADSFLVQRSPASLPTFSSPGARTPAEILMLETEALKQSLEDLQPSTSGRSPATPTKGDHEARITLSSQSHLDQIENCRAALSLKHCFVAM